MPINFTAKGKAASNTGSTLTIPNVSATVGSLLLLGFAGKSPVSGITWGLSTFTKALSITKQGIGVAEFWFIQIPNIVVLTNDIVITSSASGDVKCAACAQVTGLLGLLSYCISESSGTVAQGPKLAFSGAEEKAALVIVITKGADTPNTWTWNQGLVELANIQGSDQSGIQNFAAFFGGKILSGNSDIGADITFHSQQNFLMITAIMKASAGSSFIGSAAEVIG